jgi:hypothetical protein
MSTGEKGEMPDIRKQAGDGRTLGTGRFKQFQQN